MNKIILCEGKTDVYILGYFLINQYNWKHGKQDKKKEFFKITSENEVIEWYTNEQNTLGIWGVGGIDNIHQKLSKVIERNSSEPNEENHFKSIVLMLDRDMKSEDECISECNEWLKKSKIVIDNFQIGKWINAKQKLSSNIDRYIEIDILGITIPPDKNGALERFLIDALEEKEKEKIFFDKTRALINDIKNISYLKKRRYADKAQLGCIFSIMSPDWIFTMLDEKLNKIEWQKLPTVLETFQELNKLIL